MKEKKGGGKRIDLNNKKWAGVGRGAGWLSLVLPAVAFLISRGGEKEDGADSALGESGS